MKRYMHEARHNPFENEKLSVATQVQESMWELFLAIGKFWGNAPAQPEENLKSQLVTFMQNRILFDNNYLTHYLNAMEVIAELKEQLGDDKAYEFLFTNPGANIAPPTTRLAHVRQKVSNEFISLQLALGGFQAFGGAKNYIGYFGGANIPGQTPPYRTYGG